MATIAGTTGKRAQKSTSHLSSSTESASETSGSDDEQERCGEPDHHPQNYPIIFHDESSADAMSRTLTKTEAFKLIPFLSTAVLGLVWPLMWTVPLLLSHPSSPYHYQQVFPQTWYSNDSRDRPLPLGLFLGIFAVAVGQVCVWILFFIYRRWGKPKAIQSKGAVLYDYPEGLRTHVLQPEGFGLLIGYLAITWLLRLLPPSYYDFNGTIQWKETALCLILQDGIQFTMHLLEHIVSPAFYQVSHKPHHRFTNPRLFDAFNGSLLDTLCMINIPLFLTACLVRTANVWTYMAFGSTYACWLTLIHSEYVFPWDPVFRLLGLGTPADHHVHHKFFKYNYGHLFMWFDRVSGTYRDPQQFASKVFNDGV